MQTADNSAKRKNEKVWPELQLSKGAVNNSITLLFFIFSQLHVDGK